MNSSYPAIICALLCAAFLVELYKYAKKNDIPGWMRRLNGDVARAATDKDYLAAQLEKNTAELAKKPAPDPIREITFAQEHRMRGYPRLIFVFALVGAASLYIGLFWNGENARWPVYLGWIFLALSLAMYLRVNALLNRYSRAQLLNRRYLLQKVGGDAKQADTLRELMRYYPRAAGLKMEMADVLAGDGRVGEALGELAKAAESEPKNVDVAMMRTGMLMRNNQDKEAAEALEQAKALPQQPLDPRAELYAAALAEKGGETEKARDLLAKAREKNGGVCDILLEKDGALTKLTALSEEKKAAE